MWDREQTGGASSSRNCAPPGASARSVDRNVVQTSSLPDSSRRVATEERRPSVRDERAQLVDDLIIDGTRLVEDNSSLLPPTITAGARVWFDTE